MRKMRSFADEATFIVRVSPQTDEEMLTRWEAYPWCAKPFVLGLPGSVRQTGWLKDSQRARRGYLVVRARTSE